MTTALIDADIVCYSCAIYNEPWGWDACRVDIDALMRRIIETTGADRYEAFISGDNNFRYQVYPEYKANRTGKPDPVYRQQANGYLVTDWGARVTDGYEADDALGITATSLGDKAIICSLDKDLKQIPGNHYNWRRDEFTVVNPLDGLRDFWRSVLIGDTSDNIIGARGIGQVKAARIIDDLDNEWDMYNACRAIYNDDERLHMNCKCLWIMREEDKYWEVPKEINGPPEEENR